MVVQLLTILLLIVLSSTHSYGQEDDVPMEYLVKAKYLINLPLFTEMTSHKNNGTDFTICVIGDTPMENVLKSSKGIIIKGRPLAVSKIEGPDQVDRCQILFIAASERYRLQALLTKTQQQGILTVSDMRDFTRMGGIIGLVTVNARVTFDLNRSSAGRASITFSSHLLKLAHDIIN